MDMCWIEHEGLTINILDIKVNPIQSIILTWHSHIAEIQSNH